LRELRKPEEPMPDLNHIEDKMADLRSDVRKLRRRSRFLLLAVVLIGASVRGNLLDGGRWVVAKTVEIVQAIIANV